MDAYKQAPNRPKGQTVRTNGLGRHTCRESGALVLEEPHLPGDLDPLGSLLGHIRSEDRTVDDPCLRTAAGHLEGIEEVTGNLLRRTIRC